MTITFNTNLSALTSQRYIGIASNNASSSLAKLSSGSRIPQAKDDAAGLAIGSKLKAEVAGLTQASNNAAQATSLLQIADGALSTIGDILVRMKTLATQSSSGQLGNSERSLLNQEFSNLNSEIDRIAATANFNGTALLAGSTTVGSNVNDLVSYSANNDSSATNLIGNGFQSIDFTDSFGDGVVKISYTAATRVMNVKNMLTGVNQDITLSNTTLTVGQTESYNFGDVGVKLTINSQFAKGSDIAGLNTANVDVAAGISTTNSAANAALTSSGGSAGVVSGIVINNFSLTGTGVADIDTYEIAGSLTAGGTAAAATLGTLVVNGHTFTNSAATNNLTTTGAKTYSYSDGQGNSFDVVITVGTGFDAGNMSGGVTLTQASTQTGYTATNNTVASSGGTNGALGTSLIAEPTFLSTGPNQFHSDQLFGKSATLGGTAAAATAANIVIGGHTFTTNGQTRDLTTTGTKLWTYSDGNGNSFDLVLDVNTAFQAGNMSGTVDITAGSSAGVIENTGTARPTVTDVNLGAIPADFGDLSNAVVNLNTSSAAATSATMVIDGITFSTANTGGSTADLTTTGTKSITLASTNAGNTITIQFNVTDAFANGGTARLVLAEVGQYVGADSVTSGSTSFSFKVGTGVSVDDSIAFSLNSATTAALGIDTDDITTASNADIAIGHLNSAITAVSSRRADVGASQSRLGFASANISVAIENTTAATSAILDVDVSSEITKFTSQQVLLQAGISLEAQANQQPSLLLRLLQ